MKKAAPKKQKKPSTKKSGDGDGAEKARASRESIAQQFEYRRLLIEILNSSSQAIPEGVLATRVFGEDTAVNRKRVFRHLRALEAPDNLYGLHRDDCSRDEGRGFKWRMDANLNASHGVSMTLDNAIALELANKHLRDILPERHFEALRDYFDTARNRINAVIKRGQVGDLNRLIRRIEVTQRGQALKKADIDHGILQVIYDAIARNKCLSMTYQGSKGKAKTFPCLHPAGVVIKPPKLYLYAATTEQNAQKEKFQAFQLHLITEAKVLIHKNQVDERFSLAMHIKDGLTDVPVEPADTAQYDIEVCVTDQGNLLRDLRDYPLFNDQSLTQNSQGEWILAFRARRTYQLIEYIVSRGQHFVVRSPACVRQDVHQFYRAAITGYEKPRTRQPSAV